MIMNIVELKESDMSFEIEFETYVILLPIDIFNREKAESIENTILTNLYDVDFMKDGGEAYRLSEFMDACNNQEIDLSKYWLTYVQGNNLT